MNFDLSIDRESPFQPGKPVSPHYFKGRHSSIQKIIMYYNNARNRDVQHFFLTGKKELVKHHLQNLSSNTLKIIIMPWASMFPIKANILWKIL